MTLPFVCVFVRYYETPVKIIIQLFNLLLKAHKLEARSQVKEAFDVLLPVLKARPEVITPSAPFLLLLLRLILVADGRVESSVPRGHEALRPGGVRYLHESDGSRSSHRCALP